MEMKWLAIMMVGFVAAMAVVPVAESYSSTQCKTEALKAGKPTDDIVRICKK